MVANALTKDVKGNALQHAQEHVYALAILHV